MDDTETAINLALILLVYCLPVILTVGGLIIGSILERRHFESIRARERATSGLPIVPTQSYDTDRPVLEGRLVISSVVISLDYFKRVLASLRNIFGGNVRSYESLLDRAKREAILRLKEQAPGSDVIVNLRMETSTLAYTQSRKKGVGGVEVVAYATAITYQ